MRPRLLPALAIAGLTIGFLSPAAQATHSWGGYHWARTSNPFTLTVADNVDANWDSYLDTTISDWSDATVLDLTKVTGTNKPRTCKATAGRVEVCNATYGNTGWLGVASISITGGTHITQGTVKLNDTYFNTPTYDTPAWRNLVSCQEVGHTLGLDHQDENFNNANLGTCMDYTSNPVGPLDNEHPNSHDFEELEIIYSHLDSFTTIGGSTGGNGHGHGHPQVGNDASTWGKRVEGSHKAGFSTYVLDQGNGNRVITFVTWAR